MTKPAPDYYPDPSDPNMYRYWDGEQWTSHTHPGPAPVVANSSAANAYATIAKVMGVLAAACVALLAFLLFTDVRVGSAKCGTLISPKLTELAGETGFWACREALDSREMWTFVLIGGCVLFLVIGAVVSRAGGKA
ncbi:DUF2510 domain-containing protein [Rhodococcus sp. BH5]|uniref:DUF2510 domain-containing protein n=1 Tax=Rhodococcus sp. BH5 TaxID=2871702 RepID=UPI0022CD989D|nr:DUF2510 domain-containing protein [Rhodococcus sp. BH5]MCZ9634596.1 DUF2510 domain-containing protein [Rhodococcus sp. BH5]